MKAGSPWRKQVKGHQGEGVRCVCVHRAIHFYQVGHRHNEVQAWPQTERVAVCSYCVGPIAHTGKHLPV